MHIKHLDHIHFQSSPNSSRSTHFSHHLPTLWVFFFFPLQKPSTVNSSLTRGGSSWPTPWPMLECWLVWGHAHSCSYCEFMERRSQVQKTVFGLAPPLSPPQSFCSSSNWSLSLRGGYDTLDLFVYPTFFLLSPGDQSKILVHAKQALHLLSHLLSPFPPSFNAMTLVLRLDSLR